MALYNIKNKAFNSIERLSDLAKSLGVIVPDLLALNTVPANPYSILQSSLNVVSTYNAVVNVEDLDTALVTEVTVEIVSLGTEGMDSLLDTFVLKGNTDHGDFIKMNSVTDYVEDSDKYFTIIAIDGFKINSVNINTNLEISTELVQAETDQPCSYVSMQIIPVNAFPRLVVTEMPVTSINDNFANGVVNTGTEESPVFVPYYESYIVANFKITVESGDYDSILSGQVAPAQDILRAIKTRMSEDNTRADFVDALDATFSSSWNIVPTPNVIGTDWMSAASVTIQLDIIDRHLQLNGGTIDTVVISDSGTQLQGDDGLQSSTDSVISLN